MPLIVIDGIDGTGKATQSKLLAQSLRDRGLPVKELDFPRYSEGSGILVKQYLDGHFGSDPKQLNPYMISPMYMIDRLASYLDDWRVNYERGEWIIANRYVSSNMIHQGSKLTGLERAEYVRWNFDVEHQYLGLPIPTMTILLEIPFEISSEMRKLRGGSDIHEADEVYLKSSRTTAIELARQFDWKLISCAEDGNILSPETVHSLVMSALSDLMPVYP